MGLFDLFKGKDKENKAAQQALPWQKLTSIAQLDGIATASKSKPQVIFKHSTRCGISRMVMNQFESTFAHTAQDLDLYYLDLLTYRDVSDEIGIKFQVVHQSPQLIVVKNESVVHHSSHHDIDAGSLDALV